MSLARPWWLAALTLLVPLLVLHLRRPTLTVREVASLLVWEGVSAAPPAAERRLRRPRDPWLLALQALALCAFAVALAGPQIAHGGTPRSTVYVLDDSLWMGVGTRFDDARREIVRTASQDHGATAVVVSAGATPAVVYRGAAAGLTAALSRLHAGVSSGDLPAAITLGTGYLGSARGRMVVLRTPETPLPPITAGSAQLATRVVGSPSSDQGFFEPVARCGIGPTAACEVVATLRNGDARRRVDGYAAFVDGRRSATFRVAVPAHSTATVAFTAPAGSDVRLHLMAADALASDDTAWVSVPGAADTPRASTVTLVGDPTAALSLAQALASVPGVSLRLRTPATYRRADARASDLVVLDGYLPSSGLPPSPAVVLIDPPSLPRGSVRGSIGAPIVSGQAADNDLLDGVDLASLSIDGGAAELLRLPATLDPLVWSPAGPLFAGGDDGRQRLAVLAFDPLRSNLSQLPAFPILARNLVRWAVGWARIDDRGALAVDALPATTRAVVASSTGTTRRTTFDRLPVGLTGLAPGRYVVSASGAGVTHRRTLATTLALPDPTAGAGAAPIDLGSWAGVVAPRDRSSLTASLLVLALIAMTVDWAYWRRLRR